MANFVKQKVCIIDDASTTMKELFDASTITTFRGCGVVKIGSTLCLVWIAYEGTA
jgi:hypothetical protein